MEVSIDNHPTSFSMTAKLAFKRTNVGEQEVKMILPVEDLQSKIQGLEHKIKEAQESIAEYQALVESLQEDDDMDIEKLKAV